MGRVPVFLYDDFAWIPYMGTNLSVEHFGFYGGRWNKTTLLHEVVWEMKNLTDAQYAKKMAALRDARWHYTYPGVMHQIEMLLQVNYSHYTYPGVMHQIEML